MPAPSTPRGAKRSRNPRAPTPRAALATHHPDPISAELRKLETLSHRELQARWRELYGSPPPAHAKRVFLLRALAYRIQEEAFGGLDARTRRELAKIADDAVAGRNPKAPPASTTPGTRLLREWKGEMHEVVVLEDGVQYCGETWSSLSAVAREITGTHWSGPRFFGLRKDRRDGGR